MLHTRGMMAPALAAASLGARRCPLPALLRPLGYQLRWCAASTATQQKAGAAGAAQPGEAPQPRKQGQQQQEQQQQQQAAPAAGPRRGKQTLDYTALCACVAELAEQWVPSRVEEVTQPDAYTLSLRLRTPARQGWLHLSWHPTAARVGTGGPPARGAASEAFSFAAAAGQQLRGLVLTAASVPQPWERVAKLEFGVRPGEAPKCMAFCEIMANYSNVVLTDDAGTVISAAYQVGGKMSSLRQVQQGRAYALPPITSGVPPGAGEPAAAWRSNVERAAALPPRSGGGAAAAAPPRAAVMGGLVRAYQGVSPALAEELCAAAGVAPGAAPGELSDTQWGALHGAWLAWLERVESGRFAATMDEAGGRFSVMGSFPRSYESTHEMLEEYYSSLQASELHASLHQKLAAAARGALKKARGRVAAFEQQLKAAEGAGAVQRRADIIMANVYRIPEGAAVLEAEDWDTGEALSIPLDPEKGAVEQAEALYKRARKLRRAVDAVAPLLEAARSEAEYLEQVESEVAQLAIYEVADDLAALREIQDELVEAGALRAPPDAALAAKAAAKGRKAAKKAQARGGPAAAAVAAAGGGRGFRQYASPGGFVVLVGRNNKQNDVLSCQVANPQDIWMHVRGMPGSHVLLRVDKGGAAPGDKDVECAAALAAWFSKARASGKADVIVTRAEHVRKFKGAKPGQVILAKEDRVVVVRPQDSLAAAEAASGGGGGGGGGGKGGE